MRQMQDVYLVDFVELTLKSKENFDDAHDIVLSKIFSNTWSTFFFLNLVTGLHDSTPEKSSMKSHKSTKNTPRHHLHHSQPPQSSLHKPTQTTATLCRISVDLKKRMQLSTLISLLFFLYQKS